MSYVKLHQELFESTIWQESTVIRLAWITILLMANKDGEVTTSIPGLANRIGCSIPEAEEAIHKFLSPDKYSRTQQDEGRRLEIIEGGWVVLNHGKYRNKGSRSDAKEQNRIRQQRYRDKQQRNGESVTNNAPVTDHMYIADADADTDTEIGSERVSKRGDQPERVAKKQKRKVGSAKASPVTDEKFFTDLESDTCYAHVNILDEWAKMDRWCGVNKKQATRRRFINWINRIDKPVQGPNDAKKEFSNAW